MLGAGVSVLIANPYLKATYAKRMHSDKATAYRLQMSNHCPKVRRDLTLDNNLKDTLDKSQGLRVAFTKKNQVCDLFSQYESCKRSRSRYRNLGTDKRVRPLMTDLKRTSETTLTYPAHHE